MRTEGRITLYLSRKGTKAEKRVGSTDRAPYLERSNWHVTNWPGSLTIPLLSIKRGSHNWHNVQRTDVDFIFEGWVWHGTNLGDNDLLRCRKTRIQWVRKSHGGYGPRRTRKAQVTS